MWAARRLRFSWQVNAEHEEQSLRQSSRAAETGCCQVAVEAARCGCDGQYLVCQRLL